MESKKYNVILSDWPSANKAGRALKGYKMVDGKQIFNKVSDKSRELAYPVLTVDEMCDLPIKDLVADDAHLYFWVTNKFLLKAEKIINAWGFKYSTTLVWSKNPMGDGLGGAYGISAEYLIFATRGSLKAKKRIRQTVFHEKRQYVNGAPCHSKKPVFFHELIESVSGKGLELFAREQREGWDVFGNQVENSITL